MMKRLYSLLLLAFLLPSVYLQSQVYAHYAACLFRTPDDKAFAETYLSINGPVLFAKEENGSFRNSVNINVRILKDTTIVAAKKYNLLGPAFAREQDAPVFLDVQRYPLPVGNFVVKIDISDNHSIRKRTITIVDTLHVNAPEKDIQFSDIQPLESYSRSASPGPLSKSGFDMRPYVLGYYPEAIRELSFYAEAYHLDKVLGAGKPFVFIYYLQMRESATVLNSFGSFKKQQASAVNPLLAKMDISTLGSGNYDLIVEVRDGENKLRATGRYGFQRQNRLAEITTLQQLSQKGLEAEYFGHINNTDTLRMLVECLWPIADGVDKERIINQSVKKDPALMKQFVMDFWTRRAADTANPVSMWASYYKQVQTVMAIFKCGKQPGYYTDRGRVYLQYGPPNVRSQQTNEPNTFPYEIWLYYKTTDQSNGQLFSNRRFVFVNKMIGDDCHKLIHSDMRGEPNNPRWQFEVTRRNNNGMGDPDNNTPVGTEFNQMNELYNSPR